MQFIMQDYPQDDQAMGLSESEGMNIFQQASFLQVAKSASSDLTFENLLNPINRSQQKDHQLIWEPINNYEAFYQQLPDTAFIPQSIHIPLPPKHRPIKRKAKQERNKKRSDYDKNICGYITKKVIRQFIGNNYSKMVNQLIQKYQSNLSQCKAYYLKKIQYITGPSHLPDLFSTVPGQPTSLMSCKRVFKEFYRWFLKHRYLRYLLNEGKMEDKQAYIDYKNTYLFKFTDEEKQKQQHQAGAEILAIQGQNPQILI